MASVTGMTAEAINELMGAMVVSVRVDETGQVLFTNRAGVEDIAGPLIAPDVAVAKAWPVGSIFIGTTSTNPGSLLGIGNWVRYGEGRVLVSQDNTQTEFDAVGEVGGAKTVALSTANMPAHTHSVPAHTHSYTFTYDRRETALSSGAYYLVNSVTVGDGFEIDRVGTTSSAGGGNTSSVGSGTAVTNLQPYIVVYMWKRNS